MLQKMFVREFIEAILAAVIVAVILRFFVVSVYRIPSESMLPALVPGDFIVAFKTPYGIQIPFFEDRLGERSPVRGDVVIFQIPGEDALFVKRVVAVAGDRVEIKNGLLVINDVVTTSTFTPQGDFEVAAETAEEMTHQVMRRKGAEEPDFLAPVVVPPGQMFILGDLRTDSVDSRQWGPIPTRFAFAKAAFVFFSIPFNGQRLFKAIE